MRVELQQPLLGESREELNREKRVAGSLFVDKLR